MPTSPRLVVLRGPSASGKSTVAAALQIALGPRTALVQQDHLRRVVLRERDTPDGDNVLLIRDVVRSCLALGRDVVLEGILVAAHYRAMLSGLVAEHAGPSHLVYLEVAFDETLRRHLARPLGREVGEQQFASWHVERDVLDVPGEVVVDAADEVERTVASVVALVRHSCSAGRTGTTRPP